MDRTFYPDTPNNWDDDMLRTEVLSRLKREHVMLDIGAGRGGLQQMDFRGRASRICGIDMDPAIFTNKLVDEAKITDGRTIPYEDETFDIALANNVLEHVAEPLRLFLEIRRVLKPGGRFLFKTPNKYHYMPIVARMTPTSFHRAFNRYRGRSEVDTFPTKYAANSKHELEKLAAQANLDFCHLKHVENRPEYLRFSVPTYLVGMAFERLVNAAESLAGFRVVLMGEMQKRP
jgi:SAM-dependent methyltransferase